MSRAIIHNPEQLLPHRAPMLLLDEVLGYDEQGATSRVTICTDSPFYDGELGGVPAWVGIEYMAQTIGAWAGARRLAQDKQVEIGFLLSARRFESSTECFPLGAQLNVQITALYHEADGLGSFDCRIDAQRADGGAIDAKARINAFQPEQPGQFVRAAQTLLAAAFPAANEDGDHNNKTDEE